MIVLNEGQSYIVTITVTNTSTVAGGAGRLAPATLLISLTIKSPDITLLPDVLIFEPFAAGETRSFQFPIDIPLGNIGKAVDVWAKIFSADNNYITDATEKIIIERIVPSEPSSLLIQYQSVLEEAYVLVEAGQVTTWVMIPGFGLQYAGAAINQLKSLMVNEALGIGMIGSASEAYFKRAIMYHVDGTTIVPYWWICPYDGEKFRSPEALEQHIQEAHWEIINTKGTILNFYPVFEALTPVVEMGVGVTVYWRNDSPFSIRGRVVAPPAPGSQDTTLAPGQSIRVYFPYVFFAATFSATLTLVGGAAPGMVLDKKDAYFEAAEPSF